MSATAPPAAAMPARLVVANVNGLHSARKRHHLFHALGEGRWDVALLVETHCEGPEQARAWLQEGAGPGLPWQGDAFWCHGTRRSRGVAILVRAGFAAADLRVDYTDTDGRVLRVSWAADAGGERWAAVAVYAPVLPQLRPAFFAPGGPLSLALMAGHGSSARCLVGGDFNCVTSRADQAGPVGSGCSRLPGGAALHAAMTAAGVADAWLHLHPHADGAHMFTHVATTPAGPTMARLDRWLVSRDLLGGAPWVRHVRVLAPGALPGDHMALDLRLSAPGGPAGSRGLWSLRCELLSLPAFRAHMEACIAQHLALPYTCPMARWEGLKARAREAASAFHRDHSARLRQRTACLLRAELLARRRLVARPGDGQLAQAWRHAAHRVRRHRDERARARVLATEAKWAQLGESGTAWFHRLGRARPPRAPITALRLPPADPAGGGVTVAPAEVLQGLAAFFDGDAGGLFCQREVDLAAQQVLLDSVDVTLSPVQAAAGDGPAADGSFAADELLAALRTMPGGKCPGRDGLPYEWYAAFWSHGVGHALAEAFNCAFAGQPAGVAPLLPDTLREGVVVLLHKGKGLDRADPASYRPITLLNCDHKLLAKALVRRWSPLADVVVDPTQSAFIPGRWIGDNILFHLEEIDHCTATQQPGLILFLDWEKAYDRMDQAWVLRAMDRMGFSGPSLRWAGLMMRGVTGQVLNAGALSPAFHVRGGLPQGSPLSPLLYLLAVQPLASRLRLLQRAGTLPGISLPGGGWAPPSMQHADDTSLHVPHVPAACVALREAVQPFARASGSALSMGKLKGLMLGRASGFTGKVACLGGAFFPPASEPIRHLGVLLSATDPAGAAARLGQARRKALYARVTHWATHALSYPGRLHVAKSVLAAGLYFHAGFIPLPDGTLASLCDVVDHYVFRGHLAHGGDPPVRGRPGDVVESLPKSYGGLGRADVRAQVAALHAKLMALLLHPRRQPWKLFMAAAFERAFPGVGVAALVSQRAPTSASRAGQVLGARRLAYFRAFRRTHPHRLTPLGDMSRAQILREALAHNLSVAPPGSLFAASLPAALPAHCSRVADLLPVSGEGPGGAGALLGWLPEEWRSTLLAPEPAQPWVVSACGSFVRSARGEVHVVGRDGRIGALAAAPAVALPWAPACVVFCGLPGEPAPLAGAPPPPAALPPALPTALHAAPVPGTGGRVPPVAQAYLVGPWQDVRLDPSLWGYGTVPLTCFVARRARERMLLLAAQGHVEGWVPGAGAPPRGDGFAARDARLLAILARRVGPAGLLAGASSAGPCALGAGRRGQRRPRDITESEPLFVAPWFHRPPKRAHVLDRVARRLGAGLLSPARADDTRDVLLRAAPGAAPPPWRLRYAALWHTRLPRHLSHFGWQLLHDALPCRARLVSWGGSSVAALAEASACSASGCLAACGTPSSLETVEHAFVACPSVAPVWAWVRGVWAALTGAAPPQVPGDLLGLGPSPWVPADPDLHWLWLLFRLAVLHAVWVLRCTRDRLRPHGPQFGASDVAAAACVQVHACLRVDWANLGLAGWRPHPSGSALDSAQQAALSTFRQRWCLRGVFAEVHEGPAGPSFALALAPERYGPGAAAVPLGAAPDAAPAVVSTP